MANVCMARLRVELMQTESGAAAFPLEIIKTRLDALHYDHFMVEVDDEHCLEIVCGFRWSPPFERLLAVTADLHVNLRCLYEEEGTGFMGAWRARDGNVVQDNRIDYY